MEGGGFIPEFSSLIRMINRQPDVAKHCELTELPINRANSDANNEGHPTLLCGNLISHIVDDINALLGASYCKFAILPTVMNDVDRRSNKDADYSIFKVFNTVTYIVVN